MNTREQNWKDIPAACGLALKDVKKLFVGFIAAVLTLIILSVSSAAVSKMGGGSFAPHDLMFKCLDGDWATAASLVLPVLNPFHGASLVSPSPSLGHFVVSLLSYVLLLGVLTQCGGIISRLTVLEYAKDALPSLGEAAQMVQAKKSAYFFAPMISLVAIALCAVPNLVAGAIGCVPVIGRWLEGLLLIPGMITSVMLVFCAVLGVLSFGLMISAVSIEGKSAFESWTTAYSYVLWGLKRFVVYLVLAAAVGAVATIVVWVLAEFFVLVLDSTFRFGYVVAERGSAGEVFRGTIFNLIVLAARLGVFGFAIAYFFTANTIMCFLLRKHVDRIQIDDIYEEEAEKEAAEEVAVEPQEEQKPEEVVSPAVPAEQAAEEEAEPAPEQEQDFGEEEEQNDQ